MVEVAPPSTGTLKTLDDWPLAHTIVPSPTEIPDG
jgi:hypothetical protein